jgi:pimeloyl-ACP methyl ester carboxylesterase
MPRVTLPTGVSLYYQVSGLGEPVLLIMGTGADHSMWDVTVPAYADRFRVTTYDNRGTGQSDCPPDPESYSMRALADDAAALLDAMGVERAHVSGLSLGSTVAQELAIEHPDRVTSLFTALGGGPTSGCGGSSMGWRTQSSETTWRRSSAPHSCGS